MLKDVRAGHAFELPGGVDEARSCLGDRFAAGKLGVVQPPGKNARLVGDGSISGKNPRSRICDRIWVPGVRSVQEFWSRHHSSRRWLAFSWDVSGAHKLVLVCPEEQGYSCFFVKGRLFAYRSCYFGCRWAAH